VIFVASIHGILQPVTRSGWPWDFQIWSGLCGLPFVCQAEHNEGSPRPVFNFLWAVPRSSRAVAAHLIRVNAEARETGGRELPISMVAHSNGTIIAARAARRLFKMGQPVDTLVLIGSALHSDVRRSRLMDLVESGAVRRVVVYASRRDIVVKHLDWIPWFWGALGAKGLQLDGEAFGAQVQEDGPCDVRHQSFVTRWWDLGHSEYFSRPMQARIFACVAGDLGATRVVEPSAVAARRAGLVADFDFHDSLGCGTAASSSAGWEGFPVCSPHGVPGVVGGAALPALGRN